MHEVLAFFSIAISPGIAFMTIFKYSELVEPIFVLIGPEYNCYYHKNFLRGRPELIPLILRLDSSGKKSKGNGAGSEGENTDGEGELAFVAFERIYNLQPVKPPEVG